MPSRIPSFFATPFQALAHRGGAGYAPNRGRENSLYAFGRAVALGYRYVETDVHATADGVLVAFHDDRLDRVTDATGRIADLPYAEVARARIGGTEPIPRLDEVFEAYPDTYLNIDIKAPGAIEPLAEVIADHRAQRRVNVASFSGARLRAFRRLAGTQVSTALTPAGSGLLRLAPALARVVPLPGGVLQLPHRTDVPLPGGRTRTVTVVTAGLVAAAHRAGKKVHVWTIDDPDEMVELIDLGVDGLVSDRIDVLKQVLKDRGKWYGDD